MGLSRYSGAASAGGSDASDSRGARSRSVVSAPEDGRTPPRRSPAAADPVHPVQCEMRGYSSLALCRISAKVFEVPMREIRLFFLVLLGILTVSPASASQSIARVWDEQNLSAIRIDAANPPVHARNLFHLSAAMYDAWAAYDTNGAVGYLFREKHPAMDEAAASLLAINISAWRILKVPDVLSHNTPKIKPSPV